MTASAELRLAAAHVARPIFFLVSSVLAVALAAAPARVRAAEAAEAVLADFRAHGYASPLLAFERLEQAGAPAADAPLEQRWRFEAELSRLALFVDKDVVARAALARLQTMAENEACAPCRAVLVLRRKQLAEAPLADSAALPRSLDELTTAAEPADPGLRFEWQMARATARSALGDHETAITDALKASEIAAAHDRPADLVVALDVLAVSNASRRDLPRALDYGRRGIALAREIGFRYGLARALFNLSYARSTQKENVERKAVLEEVLQLTEATRGMQTLHQNALINLAALSNDIRDHAQAVRYATRAEQATDRATDPNGYAFAIVNRGVAWVHLGKVDEGLALVRTAVDIGEQTGDKRELADLLEQHVDALEAAGRAPAALQTLRRWVALNGELTTSQREQALAQLQERFAAQQRLREIDRLKLDNARRDAELQLRAWRERAWAAAAVLVALMAFITWQRLARSRSDIARLSDESQHDPLTGACNRRYGEALLERLERDNAALSAQQRRPVALLLLDVDHFKRVNDTHGHAAGDAVLVEMTRRLQMMLRDGDAVVRWGGEEFLLVLPRTDTAGLRVIAGRVLAAIGNQPVVLPNGRAIAIRASVGGVVWAAGSGAAWADQLALADAVLYRAKRDGRNRAILALADEPLMDEDLERLDEAVAQGLLRLATVDGVAQMPAPLAEALACVE